ncbi:type II secretion system protein [Kribbella pittospori]|uniref:Type II secretion system protein n=1 Tax=Kribbella pittospori TaxID=722689 RepID=A0A4R0KJG4_9ACTN|nr:prepilin-type N-terminal cleavage/methylation domain-containing protein [Kribbella pittospori]TCC60339.1 type II secretion system protein [Kribbella pittospori]
MKRAEQEQGFTLIEMLVAIVIIGIVMVPLSNVLIGFLRTDGTASARLDESHDAQIAATYWAQDVASIGIRQPYDLGTKTFPLAQSVNVSFPCSTPAGSSTVVTLGWDELDAAGTPSAVRVAYVRTGTDLVRLRCDGGSLTSTATLAHNLNGAPAVTCSTSCTGSGSAVPQTITLTFDISDPSGKGQPYSLTLAGQRRQS